MCDSGVSLEGIEVEDFGPGRLAGAEAPVERPSELAGPHEDNSPLVNSRPASLGRGKSVSFAARDQVFDTPPWRVPTPRPRSRDQAGPGKSVLRGATSTAPPPSATLNPHRINIAPTPAPSPDDTPSPYSRESSRSESPQPTSTSADSALDPVRKHFARRTAGSTTPKEAARRASAAGSAPPRSQLSKADLHSGLKRKRGDALDKTPERVSEVEEEEEEEAEEEIPELYGWIPPQVIERFKTDALSQSQKRIGIQHDDGPSIPVGSEDAVEIVPDLGLEPDYDWLGLVTDVRGLLDDRHASRRTDGSFKKDKLGKTKLEFATIYFQIAWLYSKQDFKLITLENKNLSSLYSNELRWLSGNERVQTDHFEILRQGRLARGQVKTLFFNDAYPAVGHPNLIGSDEHPLRVAAHPKTAEYDTSTPHYFFGDTEKYRRAEGPDQAWEGAVLVRTELALRGERVAKSKADEVEPKPKKSKRRRLTLYPPKIRSSTGEWKKLTFNKFGPLDQPYQFDNVQIFSHLKRTWYTLTDMTRKSLSRPTTETDEPGPAELAPPPSVEPDSPLAALAELGREPIVRGGAFGVTGNAYLVTRAKELVVRLALLEADSESIASDEDDEEDDAHASLAEKERSLREAATLLQASLVWKGWVEVRRRRKAVKVPGLANPVKLAFDTCPPLFAGRSDRRWVSVANKTTPILSRYEEGVLRDWQENGIGPLRHL